MADSTTPESQTPAQPILKPHNNTVVPHAIADYDTDLVQLNVWTGTKWVNIFDGNDFTNTQADLHRVAKVVETHTSEIQDATKTASDAVKAVDSAVSASKVNSDAIAAQNKAISEAKVALDSATAEIQQTAANAASDAAKIRADVAQVQNEVDTAKAANSASIEALKSDVSAAKQDLADVHDSLTKAQSAIEQNQKLINDSVAQINADITQDRKDIASAQQANADTAKQLDTYSKQATEQSKTIKTIQDKQDGFTATLADVQGNVSQVSDKVDGLSASLKDAQDNVASVKAQADQLSATLTDHTKSIATLTASAKELSSTLEDADGRLSKVEQTAQTNSSTLADVQGDLSQVKQDATTLTSTLKDAQGNISTLQQKADSVSAQLASAQGDIASLQTDVTGIKATLVSHDGDIHTLQADSKTLKDDMQDVQGNISTLQKTSTDVTSELQGHAGRISKVEQTASTLTNEFSDQDGRLSKVEQTAQGTEQTVANQQGQINDIKTDVSGVHETITGQGNQIATINTSLNGLSTKYESVSGDLGKLKSQAQWVTVTSAVDLNNFKTPCHEFLKGTVTNAPNEVAWWYLTVESSDDGNRVTQTVIADQSNNRYTRRWADGWSAWVKDATQTDVTALSNRITTNSTQITQNKQAIALKADQATVNNLSGQVSQAQAQLKVQADQISSKVSSTEYQTLKGKVDGMQIGGRNYLRNSDKSTSGWAQDLGTMPEGVLNQLAGKTITVSCDVEWSNYVQSSEKQNRLGFEIAVTRSDGKSQWFGTWVWPTTSNGKKRISTTFDVPSGLTYTVSNNGQNGYVSIKGTGTVSHAKVEIGTTATDWTPAPEDTITAIQKNSTAIDQTNQKISLKADQTEVDQVKQTATQSSSRLDTMANEIQSKVTSTDVDNIVNGKGFITQQVAQSLIDQKADTITENITGLSQKVDNNNQAIVGKIQQITVSMDGVQSIVKDKANQSQVTQLANALQIKMTGATIANASDVTLTYTGKENEYPPVAPLVGMNDVDKGSTLILSFDYVASDDTKLTPQLDGTPWVPWGTLVNATPAAKGKKGSYSMTITVNDDSWQKGNAKNLCIRCDSFKGTIEITNLVLKYADTVHDVQSTFDMLRNDINLRVTKGDLLSQINLTAGNTLIQSGKIYLDADSVVFGENSKAFIPSAYITDINADKITSGTLDAGNVRVINLTADNIHGGTLDVGNMHVKNFSANDIEAGTLSGVTIKAGDTTDFFQTSKDNIYWITDNGDQSAVLGKGTYTDFPGFNIFDSQAISLGTYAGSYLQNGTIVDRGGIAGHPKFNIEDSFANSAFDLNSELGEWGAPIDNSRISGWVGPKEFFSLEQTRGFFAVLNPDLNTSQFNIQKDGHIGAYFGGGNNGNQINLVTNGAGASVNVTGDFHVTGSKNSIVNTKQGYLAINAYETAEYYFGDIGESNTGETCQVTIGIDQVFNETVNTDITYQVFVTPYSDTHVWVKERYNNRFVVCSDNPNAEFGWELKAKRKGYESNRLRHVNVDVNPLQLKGDAK